MTIFILFMLASSGVNSLLLPASPLGVSTSFSMSQDAEAIFYNPAKFQASENYKLWCSYNHIYLSMKSVSVALSKKAGPLTLGFGFLNFDYGDMELRPSYPTEDTITYYSAHDFTMLVGGNAKISPQGNIGVNLKYIVENIYIYSDYAFALDICFAYNTEKSGITFGVTNFGTKITLKTETVNLPAKISLGSYYDLSKFIISGDGHYLVNNGEFEFSGGIHVPLYTMLTLYGAAHYREEIYPGFGIELRPGKLHMKYAGALYPKDFGMINSVGVGFEF